MALPDVTVNVKSATASRTIPTDTGQSFWVGLTERGSTSRPVLLRSLQDFLDRFGARLTSSSLYDAVETFFAEGGSRLYVSRIFGAGAVAATRNLLDAGAGVSLVVTAGQFGDVDPGTWGNSLKVAVVAVTGGFRIDVYRTIGGTDVLVESSYTLVTQADAVGWSRTNSRFVVISLGATALVPAAAASAALSTGTDGSAVVQADMQIALDRFGRDLGPGQVAAPGYTTTAAGLALLDHAQARNRFAVIDAVDTASDTTLASAAQALYAAPNTGRRYGQVFAPWDVVPGLTATTTRVVPPSARACAQYARVDALGNPNQAAAGRNGTARFAIDLSQPAWSDAQRLALNNAGVTVSRRRFSNAITTYGMRTLADQAQDARWSMAPNVRAIMKFSALAFVVGEAHEFDQVDGLGQTLGAFRGELIAAANSLYLVGALYGASPAEAFFVDTGTAINPPEQLALGIMRAQVALRVSPSAEAVNIDVVVVPITQAL